MPGATSLATPAQPRLQSSPEQQQAVRAKFGLAAESAPLIFCPGAEYGPAKRWPSRHYAALARMLTKPDEPVLLIGSAKDAAVAADIAAQAPGLTLDLCGRTTLDEAIDLIAGARQVVCNDSGLMHVAAALDRPLVAIFGSSSPRYTPPLSARAKIVSLQLVCSPCFKRECPLGHLHCLEELLPERVRDALND
jgi:heptosyltransferase-2